MMNERFITDNKEDVLSRVILRIGDDDQIYTVESPYSDADLIEMAINCMAACLSRYGISGKEIAELFIKILKKEHVSYDKKYSFLLSSSKITFIFEQYDKRNIVTMTPSINNVEAMIRCLKSNAILTTYSEGSVEDAMISYIENFGLDFPEENSSNEEESL